MGGGGGELVWGLLFLPFYGLFHFYDNDFVFCIWSWKSKTTRATPWHQTTMRPKPWDHKMTGIRQQELKKTSAKTLEDHRSNTTSPRPWDHTITIVLEKKSTRQEYKNNRATPEEQQHKTILDSHVGIHTHKVREKRNSCIEVIYHAKWDWLLVTQKEGLDFLSPKYIRVILWYFCPDHVLFKQVTLLNLLSHDQCYS